MVTWRVRKLLDCINQSRNKYNPELPGQWMYKTLGTSMIYLGGGYWVAYYTKFYHFMILFSWLNSIEDLIKFWLVCSLSWVSKRFNQ